MSEQGIFIATQFLCIMTLISILLLLGPLNSPPPQPPPKKKTTSDRRVFINHTIFHHFLYLNYNFQINNWHETTAYIATPNRIKIIQCS